MSCRRCGNCCHSQTGWLQPEDLSAIANYLGIKQEDLIDQYLVIDYLADPNRGYTYVFAPVKVNEFTSQPLVSPGKRVPWRYNEEYAPCIFWQPESCVIHPVKPLECRLYSCSTTSEVEASRREHIASSWDQDQPLFKELHQRYGLEHCRRNLAIEEEIKSIAADIEKGTISPEKGWEKIDELRLKLD